MLQQRTTARPGVFAIIALICVLTLVGSAAVVGCTPADLATAPQPESLQIVVAADTAGRIVPCGCSSNQLGGLPYRAALVEQFQEDGTVVVLDAGGAASGTAAYDREKFEAILKGEIAMGVVAHNIGRSEAAMGSDYLRGLAPPLRELLISANLKDRDGRPFAEPLRILTVAGRRLAVVGVTSPSFAAPGWTIAPPRQAVLAALKKVAGQYDASIVLAYLPEDELLELGAALPEVDLVVGGPTGQSVAPRRFGPTLVASATNEGKFIARFRSTADDPARWEGGIIEVNDRQGEDPQQRRVLADFYGILADRDYAASDTSFVNVMARSLPEEFLVAGSDRCQDCHEDDCRVWAESRHASAWKTLTAKNAHVDSYCQQCHTTGFGLPDGFVSAGRSARRTNVGCESCHGPSRRHADDPENVRTPYHGRAASQCVQCHDRENSPQFVFDEYWDEVAHGDGSSNRPLPVSENRKSVTP